MVDSWSGAEWVDYEQQIFYLQLSLFGKKNEPFTIVSGYVATQKGSLS